MAHVRFGLARSLSTGAINAEFDLHHSISRRFKYILGWDIVINIDRGERKQ